MSTSLKQMISQTIQVSTDSISFIRTEMSPTFGCEVVVDTFKGIKRCSFLWILDPNNGDPPFAATELGPGGVPCE